MSAELRAVLDLPSQIACTVCGHSAYQHGAKCLECACNQSINAVIKAGYRKALSTALERLEEAERRIEELRNVGSRPKPPRKTVRRL